MKLRVETVILELRETFTIARGSQDTVETVIATLDEHGIRGHGEASPSAYYHQSAGSVVSAIERAIPVLESADPYRHRHVLADLLETVEGNRAALCAIDLAWHDWLGQRYGVALHRWLGLDPNRAPLSSFTIGISSIARMREKVREAAGYPILKIKLGTGHDLDIMRALREETTARFRIDANCGWEPDTTLEMSRELADLGVEFIEQPLPPQRLRDMERVCRESALPLVADENAVVPEDVPSLAERFHGINIKLVKCGGILPALRMIETARALGLQVMIGCMIETSVSISAGAQLAPLVDHIDLDGALLTRNDPFEGVQIRQGRVCLDDAPGLGVRRST